MSERTTDPIVTPSGRLVGLARPVHGGGQVRVFKGIRFAQASRFEPPIDITAWDGTFEALTFGAQAPQNSGTLEGMVGGTSIPQGEDCLSLNVYAPASPEAPDNDRLRPVMMWVHGGAYLTGGGAMPWYDGSRLAIRGDVVVVTINYRLGALGFLGDRNLGTLDQVSALRWVQHNIAAFGGDPGNVTVFGESAGGSAAIALMATPSADHLFHRAWAMSPSISQLRTLSHARRFEAEYLELAGVDSVEQLCELPVARLLAAQAAMAARAGAGLKIFSPTDGTPTIPQPFSDVVANDSRALVLGTTRDEFNLFSTFDQSRVDWNDDDVQREFAQRFGEQAPDAIREYRRHVPSDSSGPTNPANRLVTMMQTDEIFRWPAWSLANRRGAVGTEASSSTWMYAFDFVSSAFGGLLGSCHAVDIPFAFDNLHRPGVGMFTGETEGRQAIADQFATALLQFAHTGTTGWPAYDNGTRSTQRIGPTPELVDDPDSSLHLLWSGR